MQKCAQTYDYEVIAEICSNHMLQLFPPKYFFCSPVSAVTLATQRKHLLSYISSILHRSSLDISVAVAAMTLLFRYKAAIQASGGRHDEDADRLFMAAYMVASLEVCAVSYQEDFWMDVTNDRFWGGELETMERNFHEALHGDVQVDVESFAWFKTEMYAYTRDRRATGNESDYGDDFEDYSSSPPDYEEVARGRGAASLLGSPSGSEFDESDEDVETLARIFRDSTSLIDSDSDDSENILISKGKKLISTCRKKISQIASLNVGF